MWCFLLQRSVVLIATSWTRRERHAPRHPDSQNSVLSADFALNLLKHSLLPPQRHQRTVTPLKVFHAADGQWPSLSRPHHISLSSCHAMCQSVLKLQLESLQEESKHLLKSRHAVLKKSFTFIICMNECCVLFYLCVLDRIVSARSARVSHSGTPWSKVHSFKKCPSGPGPTHRHALLKHTLLFKHLGSVWFYLCVFKRVLCSSRLHLSDQNYNLK